jgi:hypothetical protein
MPWQRERRKTLLWQVKLLPWEASYTLSRFNKKILDNRSPGMTTQRWQGLAGKIRGPVRISRMGAISPKVEVTSNIMCNWYFSMMTYILIFETPYTSIVIF